MSRRVCPGVTLENQREEVLLWIWDEFLLSELFHGKIIVHGHTPRPAPEVLQNRINLDTGAFKWAGSRAYACPATASFSLDGTIVKSRSWTLAILACELFSDNGRIPSDRAAGRAGRGTLQIADRRPTQPGWHPLHRSGRPIRTSLEIDRHQHPHVIAKLSGRANRVPSTAPI